MLILTTDETFVLAMNIFTFLILLAIIATIIVGVEWYYEFYWYKSFLVYVAKFGADITFAQTADLICNNEKGNVTLSNKQILMFIADEGHHKRDEKNHSKFVGLTEENPDSNRIKLNGMVKRK